MEKSNGLVAQRLALYRCSYFVGATTWGARSWGCTNLPPTVNLLEKSYISRSGPRATNCDSAGFPKAGRLDRTAPTMQPTGCELLTTSHEPQFSGIPTSGPPSQDGPYKQLAVSC